MTNLSDEMTVVYYAKYQSISFDCKSNFITGIKERLIAPKSFQTQYYNYDHVDEKERQQRETSVIAKCLSRANEDCSFFCQENVSIVYRKFTALCLICGVSKEENELAIQELLNAFMDCLVAYFQHVSELDIVYNIERVYMILDEVIVNGCIGYTSKERALIPLQLSEAAT